MKRLLITWILTVLFVETLTVENNAPCPSNFIRLYNKCYHFSKKAISWMDAYHTCHDSNGSLINNVIQNKDITILSSYLRKGYFDKKDYWLGAMFNTEIHDYVWADSAVTVNRSNYGKFFSKEKPLHQLNWSCLIFDSKLNYKWNAAGCFKNRHFICVKDIFANIIPVNGSASLAVAPDIIFEVVGGSEIKKKSIKPHLNPENLVLPDIHTSNTRNVNNNRNRLPNKGRYECPRFYRRAAKYCYHFSSTQLNWQDAYYYCQKMGSKTEHPLYRGNRGNKLLTPSPHNSTLAIVSNRREDRALRRLAARIRQPGERQIESRWLGGRYDWMEGAWRWAESGAIFQHQRRAAHGGDERLRWHCLLWDPKIDDKWTTSNCSNMKYFLCQTKAKIVPPQYPKK